MAQDFITEIVKLIFGKIVFVDIANNKIKEVATTHFNIDL